MESKAIKRDGVDITVHRKVHHGKASEAYLDVTFAYPERTCEWSVPIEYRRTGTDLTNAGDDEVEDYLIQVYKQCDPKNWEKWRADQNLFWADRSGSTVTKPLFDELAKDFDWYAVAEFANTNPARRYQALKEFGYTIATRPNRIDPRTGKRSTLLLLLPLPRGGISGYETWSPQLRARIIKLLQSYDAYEARVVNKEGLLPEHKFPEIRWDKATRRESLEQLTDEEIKRDFQLLNNQRNQQKREVCRRCFQEDKRGYPYGIKYYHIGNEDWPPNIPKVGKEAEKGCFGCGWYDIEAWRQAIIQALSED